MVGWARTLLLAAAVRAAEDLHLARLRQAAQLQNDGRLSEAVPIYEDVLRQVPAHPDALHLSGLAALAAGDAAKAKELVERASSLRPNDPTMLSNLGEVYRSIGDASMGVDLRVRRGRHGFEDARRGPCGDQPVRRAHPTSLSHFSAMTPSCWPQTP